MKVEVASAVRGSVPKMSVGRTIIVFDAFWHLDPEPQYFLWGCPTCGNLWSGWLTGPKPPPGDWSAWSLTGSRERPTLSPSLVCAMARPKVHGDRPPCPGHFWMRDGELVVA